MKQHVTVSLPEKITSELTKIAKREGLSKSQIVRNALEEYIFIKRFRELRNKMMAKAQAQGVFTEEDVFEKMS
ncbi:MAG: CopG family transcriptional regulator [Calditrichaeota bacterium]|nr:MAG: CopG family transcriptional regulator [Calditrichota bacterium]